MEKLVQIIWNSYVFEKQDKSKILLSFAFSTGQGSDTTSWFHYMVLRHAHLSRIWSVDILERETGPVKRETSKSIQINPYW